MKAIKSLGLAGLGIGIAFASGCVTRGSGSFENPAEPDITPVRAGENPMPAALAPVQPGAVRYPDPRPAKSPEYWQQHSDPYAGMPRTAPSRPASYTAAPTAGGTIYVVKKGDILGRIASQHGVKVSDLKAANGLTGDTIRVGQKLRIPAKSASAPKTSAAASTPGVYVVKKGDILGRIASQHGVKVADLKAANGLTGDTIRVGQKLKIPGKAAASASAKAVPAPAPAPHSSNEVKPAVNDVPAMPDIPDLPPPAIDAAPPAPAPEIKGFEPAPAAPETYTYYASGSEDIYSIAISHTVGIPDAKRLNPQLAAEFDRMPSRPLPAGTPVILPKK